MGIKTGRKEIHGHCSRGKKRSKEYVAYDHMKRRCYDPKHHRYENYGGNGITVCDRWRQSFVNFLSDVGVAPSKFHSLDRFPNQKGNYEPGNVRWATPTQQARNMKSNRLITYSGETLCLSEWAEKIGIDQSTIASRLRSGWSEADSVSKPIK